MRERTMEPGTLRSHPYPCLTEDPGPELTPHPHPVSPPPVRWHPLLGISEDSARPPLLRTPWLAPEPHSLCPWPGTPFRPPIVPKGICPSF